MSFFTHSLKVTRMKYIAASSKARAHKHTHKTYSQREKSLLCWLHFYASCTKAKAMNAHVILSIVCDFYHDARHRAADIVFQRFHSFPSLSVSIYDLCIFLSVASFLRNFTSVVLFIVAHQFMECNSSEVSHRNSCCCCCC